MAKLYLTETDTNTEEQWGMRDRDPSPYRWLQRLNLYNYRLIYSMARRMATT